MANNQFLKRVNPGDPVAFNAEDHNAFVEAANWVRAQNKTAGGKLNYRNSQVRVTIRNDVLDETDAEVDLERFQVVRISGVIIEPTDDLPTFLYETAFIAEKPDPENFPGNLAIVQEPIEFGKFGAAVISGITVARCKDSETGQSEIWDAEDHTMLTKAKRGGGCIQHFRNFNTPSEETEDAGWAYGIVRVGIVTPQYLLLRGTAAAAIAAGATGSVTASTGEVFEVTNPYGHTDCESGAICWFAGSVQTGFYLITWECPAAP